MNGRDMILSRLRTALDRVENYPANDFRWRASATEQRIHKAGPVLLPDRGRAEGLARIELFASEAKLAQAEVRRLAAPDDVPQVVADILKSTGWTHLKIAPDDRLQALDFTGTALDITCGSGAGGDHAGLSWAYGAVAETGTLVMRSGPASPTTLNFLPDWHFVVLSTEDIAANYEQVWARLREEAEPDTPVMPRTINWITGPSRTADIEQTLLLGAHGPRKLFILLIDAETI